MKRRLASELVIPSRTQTRSQWVSIRSVVISKPLELRLSGLGPAFHQITKAQPHGTRASHETRGEPRLLLVELKEGQ